MAKAWTQCSSIDTWCASIKAWDEVSPFSTSTFFYLGIFRIYICLFSARRCKYVSLTFQIHGLLNKNIYFRYGEHFIYQILNWKKPAKSIIVIVGTLVLVIIVHFLVILIQKARSKLYKILFAPVPEPIVNKKHVLLENSEVWMIFFF